jgi:hypothetical protein
METSSLVQCMNELLQLYVSDVQPRLQLATAQAMHIALDKCSDVVHITDQNLNIQVNMYLCNSRGGRCAQCRHQRRLLNGHGNETLGFVKD